MYRNLDKVIVKGKKEPVVVYEILNGNSQRIIDLKLSTKQNFELGISLYQEKQFSEAIKFFEKVLEKDPKDKAAILYHQSSHHFLKYGVPPDWRGVKTE